MRNQIFKSRAAILPSKYRMLTEPALKTSFPAIADDETRILILGSLPGDRSLQLDQYYGHPQNRFWRVIANITGSEVPLDYEAKLAMLLHHAIGVWDVVHQAKRKGSLDTNIVDEVPNDLDSFLASHRNIHTVAFNGAKAQKLFDKYFARRPELKYLALPSTSPANAGINFQQLCERWNVIRS